MQGFDTRRKHRISVIGIDGADFSLIRILVRILVTLGLLLYIVLKINIREVTHTLQDVNLAYVLGAFVLSVTVNVLYSNIWKLVLGAQGISVPFPRLLTLQYIGLFFNNFMPTVMGGDVIKAYQLSRYTTKSMDSASSVLVTRLVSYYALLLIATVSLLAGGSRTVLPTSAAFLLTFLTFGSTLVFLLSGRLLLLLCHSPIIKKIPYAKMALGTLHASLIQLQSHRSLAALSLVNGVACNILGVLCNYLLALALGLSIPFYYFFVFVPLVTLLLALPISIGGFGLREGTFVVFLAPLGISASAAVSLSLLGHFVRIVSSLGGGVFYALGEKGIRDYAVLQKD